MTLTVKGGIKREHGTGALQTVTDHFELLGGMDIFHAVFDHGTVSLAPVKVQVAFLSRLEEEEVAGGMHIAELGDLLSKGLFFELGLKLKKELLFCNGA